MWSNNHELSWTPLSGMAEVHVNIIATYVAGSLILLSHNVALLRLTRLTMVAHKAISLLFLVMLQFYRNTTNKSVSFSVEDTFCS